MSGRPASILVLGGGPSGYTVVDQLRLRGYRGDLTLVTQEGLPADRPPVSKEYLRGAMGAEELRFREAQWYAERGIHVIVAEAVAMDPDAGEVRLASGEQVAAELVVLATGARPLSAAAAARLPGMVPLYTARDADAVRAALHPGARVVVLGGGLIGSEAASAALEAGAEVTLVNRSEVASSGVFGAHSAQMLHRMHAERGIRVLTSRSVQERSAGDGVEVQLEDGTLLAADLVIDAGGAVPDDMLAREAGLAVADDGIGGVLVDAAGHTSHAGVLAVGDVARRVADDGTPEPWAGHWEAAMHSAEDAVAELMGQAAQSRGARWFWSDRHGRHVEVVGDPGRGEVLTRQDEHGLRAVFAVGERGELLGAVTFDDPRLARAARRLIDRGAPVDGAALADPAVSARELVRPRA